MRGILRAAAVLLGAAFFLACLPEVSAAPAQWKYVKIGEREYISLNRVAGMYRFRLQKSGKNIVMSGKYHRFVFTLEKTPMLFNGVNITLNFAPLEKKGILYLSRVDFDTTVRAVLSAQALKKHKVAKIVLDPGHGGKDTGARNRMFRECTLNLQLARKLKIRLEKYGYKVILTRNSDVFVDLARRPEIAEERDADLFISLHKNASLNRSVNGIETYCLTPKGAASTSGGKPDFNSYNGNALNCNNFVLAYLIQRSLIAKTNATDLGVKHARFLVLKNSTVPAVLIESGFISNYTEAQLIGSDSYQNILADAIAQGIRNYHKAVIR